MLGGLSPLPKAFYFLCFMSLQRWRPSILPTVRIYSPSTNSWSFQRLLEAASSGTDRSSAGPGTQPCSPNCEDAFCDSSYAAQCFVCYSSYPFHSPLMLVKSFLVTCSEPTDSFLPTICLLPPVSQSSPRSFLTFFQYSYSLDSSRSPIFFRNSPGDLRTSSSFTTRSVSGECVLLRMGGDAGDAVSYVGKRITETIAQRGRDRCSDRWQLC
jgi:hypothetical protein